MLICDQTDKEKYFIEYRMSKFFVRHGMIIDKVPEVILFKQNGWLQRYRNLFTPKINHAVNDFAKDFYILVKNAFYGKTMENDRIGTKIEFTRKDDKERTIKQQSKLTFSGTHKSYTNCDNYTFKRNEVLMDNPIYLGFAVLELSKVFSYETYFDELQAYFGREILQLHYMDCDGFVLSIRTRNITNDLKHLE